MLGFHHKEPSKVEVSDAYLGRAIFLVIYIIICFFTFSFNSETGETWTPIRFEVSSVAEDGGMVTLDPS